MNKTVSWVAPDIGDPTDRGVRYINVAFADGDTGFIGKKDLDAALEVHGLLTEAIGKELDFTLEDTGNKNKKGGSKFKIKAFGDYQPTPFQGGGTAAAGGGPHRGRSPEHDQFIQERMDRRTALMQAAAVNPVDWKTEATLMYDWLRHTSDVSAPPLPGVAAAGASDASVPGGAERAPGMAAPTAPTDGEGVDSPGTTHVHDLDMTVAPKAGGRRPCKTCGAWARAA